MRKKDIIILLTSILIFVIIWIGFIIYGNSASSTISESVTVQLSPIAPNFDTKTIDKLKKRQSVVPVFQANIPVSPPVTPSDISRTISSGSARQATSGGSLLQ